MAGTYLKLADNASTTLNGALTDSITSVVVASVSEMPSTYPYILTIWDGSTYTDPGDDSSMEKVLVTSGVTNTLTVTRGYDGTTGVAHTSGEYVALLSTSAIFDDSTYGIETVLDAHLDDSSTHLSSADRTKFTGIESGATADQSNSEIKTAYEANADTNEFSDAEQTKLSGIETSADVTDATNVAAAGAVMDSDTALTTDTIDEQTGTFGVTIETVLVKDGLVDSRDVSVDGTKLDTIETNATADQTASEVPIVDSGAIITAPDVEGALQENRTAINLNTAKDTNVSTDLSEGTTTTTTVDVNSSDGTNATLLSASTSRAGVLTKDKFDEIVANNAKATNATHTGDITGDGALTIAADAVTYAKMQNVVNDERVLGRVSGANGVIEELTKTQALTMLNVTDGANAITAQSFSESVAHLTTDADAGKPFTITSFPAHGQITAIRVRSDFTAGQQANTGSALVNDAGGILPTDLSITYDNAVANFAANDYAWLEDECVFISADSGTVLTVTRGAKGTTAAFHDDNTTIVKANNGIRLVLYKDSNKNYSERIIELSSIMTYKGVTDDDILTTGALTGTVTFTNASTAVSGSGTAFLTEVNIGSIIRLDADGTYVSVASVTDNTNLVLIDTYSDTGGAGAATRGDATHFGLTADIQNLGHNDRLVIEDTVDEICSVQLVNHDTVSTVYDFTISVQDVLAAHAVTKDVKKLMLYDLNTAYDSGTTSYWTLFVDESITGTVNANVDVFTDSYT